LGEAARGAQLRPGDRDGRSVWAFERCGANSCAGSSVAPILEFDPAGKLVRSFGAGMVVFPHGLFIDKGDNVWVTDADAKDGKGDQVLKFSRDGKLLLALGKAGVSGEGPDTFNKPTAVVVAANGDLFVADGHGNSRIVKLGPDGHFIKAWGKHGSGPGEFATPHGLALDAQGRLFVADRENNRLQIFDQNGKFIAEWHQFGRPSDVFIDKRASSGASASAARRTARSPPSSPTRGPMTRRRRAWARARGPRASRPMPPATSSAARPTARRW
jgi:outer membrane protein assembly factor BamB